MADVSDVAEIADVEEASTGVEQQPALGFLLAGLLAGAGVIHLVMIPSHIGESWAEGIAFAAVGWAQIAAGIALLLGRGSRRLYAAVILGSAGVVGLWVWSRTVGLPFGAHPGVVESVGLVDQICAALELGAVLVAGAMLFAPSRLRIGMLGASVAAVAVLGLATAAIVSPDASSHGAHAGGPATGTATAAAGATVGHADHAAGSGHVAQMAAIDLARCDLGFNPQSYWDDAAKMGVDTYGGGSMQVTSAPTLNELVAGGDPLEGRGSEGLDKLIAATSQSSGGEGAAAGLILSLSDATDADYTAWTRWMGAMSASGTAGGGHGHASSAAAPSDNGGHGGHAGPQPWTAMVDQVQCDTLDAELSLARSTALKYPTAADAMAAGWERVTFYVPGIAAHYMKYGVVDGKFQIDQPEMILYDGNTPEARVVGLSYYMIQPGQAEPSQGFTGANDHSHRHVGLCNKAGVGVIGDSTLTAEECAAIGGIKSDGSKGWMSHAWVVPGCESPWGVFSAASPLLDGKLEQASTTNAGACSGSGVRDRYELRSGRPPVAGQSGVEESAAGE